MSTTYMREEAPRPDEFRSGRAYLIGGAAGIMASVAVTAYLVVHEGQIVGPVLLHALCFWGLWGCIAPMIMRLGRYVTELPQHQAARTLIVAAAGVPIVAAHLLITIFVLVAFQPYRPARVFDLATAAEWATGLVMFVDLLMYATLVLLGGVFAASQRARELELRESRLETELARAQLHALRLEIEPHFLFNTLNGISALVRVHAYDKALAMLLALSEVMRDSLEVRRQQLRPLSAELEFTRHYIDLQKLRFGDRLTVDYELPQTCGDVLVPILLLQPLVENAFRHGLKRRDRDCHLAITAGRHGDTVWLSVRDSGIGLPADFDKDRFRTGLTNTTARLHRLYGGRATLELRRLTDGTEVYVTIPAPTSAVAQEVA